jgi:hypothetical protein
LLERRADFSTNAADAATTVAHAEPLAGAGSLDAIFSSR